MVTFTYRKREQVKEKTRQMSDIGTKSLFGELALIFESKRTATIRTLSSCHVLKISKQAFNLYMREPILKRLS
jgi:CRP-like cAMP-binding protein